MSTYSQYSEIVAAYGYRLPPPPRPQASRLGLAFLYAGIGVALGTFTGTALAVASLQPGAPSISNHFSLAKANLSGLRVHTIANSSEQPVIQDHAAGATNSSAPAAAPVEQSDNQAADSSRLPNVHLAPPFESHAAMPVAGAKPSPAVHVPSVTQQQATSQIATAAPAPVVQTAPAVRQLQVNPPAAGTHAAPVSMASAEPVQLNAPTAYKQILSGASRASLAPRAAAARPPVSTGSSLASMPGAMDPSSLEGGYKPLAFYSEGDATVVGYDAAEGTIQTDDGRTFVIGSTVSVSTAVSWQDYRANVHYRCSQGGHCSLMRTGVIALDARLI